MGLTRSYTRRGAVSAGFETVGYGYFNDWDLLGLILKPFFIIITSENTSQLDASDNWAFFPFFPFPQLRLLGVFRRRFIDAVRIEVVRTSAGDVELLQRQPDHLQGGLVEELFGPVEKVEGPAHRRLPFRLCFQYSLGYVG